MPPSVLEVTYEASAPAIICAPVLSLPKRVMNCAATVVFVSFVNRFLPRFIRQGASHILMGDVRRRIRGKKALV